MVGAATWPAAQFVHNTIEYSSGTDYYWVYAVDSSGNSSTALATSNSRSIKATLGEVLDQFLNPSATTYREEVQVIADSFVITQPDSNVPTWTSGQNWNEGDVVYYNGADTYDYYYAATDLTNDTEDPETDGGTDWINFDITSLPATTKVFRVGKVDGSPAVGIRGDLMVDGGIVAKHIAADTITGTQITGDSLSGIFADLGTITAGEITIGDTTNGLFTVSTAGLVTLSSGTAGARVVQDSTSYKVYDSGGVVRVQLGDLT